MVLRSDETSRGAEACCATRLRVVGAVWIALTLQEFLSMCPRASLMRPSLWMGTFEAVSASTARGIGTCLNVSGQRVVKAQTLKQIRVDDSCTRLFYPLGILILISHGNNFAIPWVFLHHPLKCPWWGKRLCETTWTRTHTWWQANRPRSALTWDSWRFSRRMVRGCQRQPKRCGSRWWLIWLTVGPGDQGLSTSVDTVVYHGEKSCMRSMWKDSEQTWTNYVLLRPEMFWGFEKDIVAERGFPAPSLLII